MFELGQNHRYENTLSKDNEDKQLGRRNYRVGLRKQNYSLSYLLTNGVAF